MTRSYLEGVARGATADVLIEAVALGARAAEVGFDWPDARDALDKVEEEVIEVKEVLESPPLDRDALRGELGDLLFSVCMVARLADIDPGEALAETNAKFRRRFSFIEQEFARRGVDLASASLDEMEAIWQLSKQA